MQIVYHIGAHCTDEDALLKSLVKNKEMLAQRGTLIPNPGRYRPLLRDIFTDMAAGKHVHETRESALQQFLGRHKPQRIVLSNRNFICVPNRIFEAGEFYTLADDKLQAMGEFFPNDQLEIMMGMRDPASFIPAAFAQSSGRSFETFLNGVSVDDLYWSDLIDRIRMILPKAKITVWCNEDTPFIWPQILRAMGNVPPQVRITGGYDLMARVLSPDGVKKLQVYLRSNPPKSEPQRLKILSAFLDQFGVMDELEDEIDTPGWTEDLMEDLSETYDEDMAEIAARGDVTFLEPNYA